MAKKIEDQKERKPIYYNMNMPNWFMNKNVTEKCDIVTVLAEQLENEKPISKKEREELFSIS